MAILCLRRRNNIILVLALLFVSTLYYTLYNYKSKIKVDVVFIIFSSPANEERRNTIRNTWFSKAPKNVKMLFAIGSKSSYFNDLVIKENSANEDLLLLDFVDSYSSLTEKLLGSVTHLIEKYEFKYIFKGDDDTFVRLKPFLSLLAKQTRKKLYWGYFAGNARVKLGGKWEESNWFLCDKYLPYARGGGYVISYDIANFISINREMLDFYNSEDVSLGVWLSALKIERRHDRKFNTEFESRGCNNNYLVMHKTSTQLMKEYSKNLKEGGQMCSREYKSRPSYDYNWNVLPSLCCFKNNQSNFY